MRVQSPKRNRRVEHKALRKEFEIYADTWPNLVVKHLFAYFLIFKRSHFDFNLLANLYIPWSGVDHGLDCLAFLMENQRYCSKVQSPTVLDHPVQPQAGCQRCLHSNRESNRGCCRRCVKCWRLSGQKLPIIPLWLAFVSLLSGLFSSSPSLMCRYICILESKDSIEYIVYIPNKEVCVFLYPCKHFSLSLTASNMLFCQIVHWRVKCTIFLVLGHLGSLNIICPKQLNFHT